MNKLMTCTSVEFKKFLHSKVPYLTMLALLVIPFIGGFFMFILKDPALAQKMGVISAKAQLVGTADWPTFLGFLSQAISIGGVIVFGFITSWVFGREYSDRTIKDLLALPISRNVIVYSKFIVVFLWCSLLAMLVFALGLVVGNAVVIPGWSPDLVRQGFAIFSICALLTISLSTPVAIFASIGRGYLSPLGFVVLTIVLAQIVAATGYGQFFPWAIPALASGVAGSESGVLENYSVFIVLTTSAIGLIGTTLWWRYSDQN